MLRAAVVVLCGRTAYATETAKVEGSLTFTVGGMTYAEGINGHLYVKLWSGTSPIPLSPTVSVPTYTGSCSTAYRDDDWSGPSGWLKLDAIDVSTKGLTSSQSLGSLDPTLPLTHIEFYYNENNGLGVQDVSIQVGDAYYGVPEDWTLVNGGNGWLETDQRCVWWMEIEMRFLSTPAPSPRPTLELTTTGSFTFQAGRCYPQSEAPVINTAGLMSSTLRRTGTPQECYDYCTDNSGFNIMGLDLRPTGGQDCQCNHPSLKSRERGETKSRFARRQSSRGRLQRWTGL